MDRSIHKPPQDFTWNPPYIVLETKGMRNDFYSVLKTLPCFEDMEWDLLLGDTVEYLADYETAHGNILECVYQIRNQFAAQYPEAVVTALGLALRDFMVELFEYLERIKAYEDGAFNWAFSEFIHGDMVLFRIE